MEFPEHLPEGRQKSLPLCFYACADKHQHVEWHGDNNDTTEHVGLAVRFGKIEQHGRVFIDPGFAFVDRLIILTDNGFQEGLYLLFRQVDVSGGVGGPGCLGIKVVDELFFCIRIIGWHSDKQCAILPGLPTGRNGKLEASVRAMIVLEGQAFSRISGARA